MREEISKTIETATDLAEVENRLLEFIHDVKAETNSSRIGYVAGIVSSDGEEHIATNIKKLSEYTDRIAHQYSFPVFCAADVFNPQLFEQLAEMKLEAEEREQHLKSFWRNILNCGYITDIFMTPRWQLSGGSKDEHETAGQNGIIIHYV